MCESVKTAGKLEKRNTKTSAWLLIWAVYRREKTHFPNCNNVRLFVCREGKTSRSGCDTRALEACTASTAPHTTWLGGGCPRGSSAGEAVWIWAGFKPSNDGSVLCEGGQAWAGVQLFWCSARRSLSKSALQPRRRAWEGIMTYSDCKKKTKTKKKSCHGLEQKAKRNVWCSSYLHGA